MGATRLITTLAILGIGAGAYLAVTATPSFAPYEKRRNSLPVVIAEPSAPAADLARPARDEEDSGFRVSPDWQQGTVVLELPQWAQETGRWYDFGRRAMDELGAWTQPFREERTWDDPRGTRDERPRWREDEQALAPRQDLGSSDDEASGYAPPQRWSRSEDDRGDAMADADDAASRAAERAQEAARDVYAAQGAAS